MSGLERRSALLCGIILLQLRFLYCREVGRRRAAALQQAAPLAAAAAGSSGGSSGGKGAGSEHAPQQAAEVQQLRRVLRKQIRRRGADAYALGSSNAGRHGSPASAALGASPASSPHLAPASRRRGAVNGDRGPALPADDGTRPLVPLALSPRARQERLEQSVAVNKQVCRMFDDLHRKLNSGGCCIQVGSVEAWHGGLCGQVTPLAPPCCCRQHGDSLGPGPDAHAAATSMLC